MNENRNLVLSIILSIIIFTLARPQWGEKKITVKQKGIDILIMLDTSMSMLAEDIKPNRIEKAKFRKPVTPGNELFLKINLISNKRALYKFNGEAFIQNQLVASSEFSAMLVHKEKAK